MKRALLSLSPLFRSTPACNRTFSFARFTPHGYLSMSRSTPTATPFMSGLHVLRTPLSALPGESVWRFVASKIAQATHRSGVVRGASGGGHGGGPQGPFQRLRARINAIPSSYIFWGIIGLNGLVFASWHLAYIKYQSTGDSSSYAWMMQNFVSSSENLRGGRWWTLVTCCFSHEDTMHLLFNGFTYYFMAPLVLSLLGNVGFLGLYLGGGIVSSLAGIAWRNYNPQHSPRAGSHGASGAIYSVISFFACVAPTATFALFGIIPLPAWAFVTGIFLYDGYSAINDKRVGTDTAGHIGGLLAGIGYFVAKRLRIF
ncbi:hypothetical protein BV20DRAFT_944427 [Pilatotrama ljubarskyi]|nr:hypothetical protein BV20DRAFT_944427 [Pilatotrama ljubarskyi]